MHRRVLAALAAEDLVGAIREHFVRVHVVRRARAGLIRIDDELVAMLAGEHFVGRLRRSRRRARASRRPVSLCVSAAAFLIHTCAVDERLERLQAADRKVLHGAQRLHAVQRVAGNVERAEGIFFAARIRA